MGTPSCANWINREITSINLPILCTIMIPSMLAHPLCYGICHIVTVFFQEHHVAIPTNSHLSQLQMFRLDSRLLQEANSTPVVLRMMRCFRCHHQYWEISQVNQLSRDRILSLDITRHQVCRVGCNRLDRKVVRVCQRRRICNRNICQAIGSGRRISKSRITERWASWLNGHNRVNEMRTRICSSPDHRPALGVADEDDRLPDAIEEQ